MDFEEKKREKQKRQRRKIYVNFISILALVIMFAGLIFLSYFVICKRADQHFDLIEKICVVFIGGVIEAIGFHMFFKVNGERLRYKWEDQHSKYDAYDLSILKKMSRNRVEQLLLSNKFKSQGNGVYRRRIYGFWKDICYYAKCTETDNLMETIEQELEQVDVLYERAQNICTFLFIYKNVVAEEDLNELVKWSKYLFIPETVFPSRGLATSVTVLIDSNTNEGYFLEMKAKWHIAVYFHGCRLLKKIFKHGK